MLKNTLVLFGITSLLATTMVSCKGNKAATQAEVGAKGDIADFPDWVVNPGVDGKFSAVGIADKTNGGMKVQVAQAEADGRANLATKIEAVVSRLTKDAMRKADLDGNENVEKIFEQATKEVVKNVPISGAAREKMFRDTATGELYILMTVDTNVVKNYLQAHQNDIVGTLNKANLSKSELKSAQESFKGLFNELSDDSTPKAPAATN